MHSRCPDREQSERGSVTAEFAIALPVIVLLLAMGIGALAATAAQVRLVGAASAAARVLGRGEDEDRARSIVSHAVAHAALAEIDRQDGLVCVTAMVPVRIVGVSVMTVTAHVCALDAGW